jgi:predicted deacylase
MERTLIATDIDFDRDGKQVSILRLPCSTDTSAYGIIPLPIAVIKNGAGPTVLLMGANHGDEFEGPVTLGKLIRELAPDQIKGRLIILPAANFPAAIAGRRNSPLDGLNLNRSFPGNADGSATQQIAHYIAKILMPMADAVIDLHSGGYSLDFVFCANIYRHDAGPLRDATLALAKAFSVPLTVMFDDRGEERTILATAKRLGIPALTTELGGGATLSVSGVRLCMEAVCRALVSLGAFSESMAKPADHPTRFVEIKNQSSYVYAPCDGLFETFDEMGSDVEAGARAGCIHFLADPARRPVDIFYGATGLLCMKRPPAMVKAGDCLLMVVSDV